jgi:hypothetical protein
MIGDLEKKTVVRTKQSLLKRPHDYEDFSGS